MKNLLLLMTVGFSEPAFAYVDPGTGTLLLQGFLASIVGALLGIKLYWKKISSAIARLFKRRQTPE